MKRAAEVAFKQTIALRSDYSESVSLFANLLQVQKRLDGAQPVLETCFKINPTARRLGHVTDELGVKE